MDQNSKDKKKIDECSVSSQNVILNLEQISNKGMDVFFHNPPQINNQEFICSNDHQNHAIFAKIGFGLKQKP